MPKILVNDKEYGTFEEIVKIDDPELKNQAIKEFSYAEHEGSKSPKKDDPEKDTESKDDINDKETEDEKDPEKDDRTDEDSDEEEEKESTSEENKDDVKSDDDTSEDDPEKDDDETQEEDQIKQQEERIKSFATKNNVTIDDAKKEIEQIDTFKKHFDNDVDEIAKVARVFQQKVTMLNEEKRQQELSKSSPFEWREDGMIFHGIREDGTRFDEKYSKDNLVENFRKNNVADTETLDDDAVFILAKRDNEQWQRNESTKRNDSIVKEAEAKKESFLKNLPEKDAIFKDDLKLALGSLSPYDVAGGSQSMTAALNLVKGIRFDKKVDELTKEIKAAEKRGFERGKKNAVILGEEEVTADSKGGEKKKKSDSFGYTPDEKKAALEFFANHTISDDKKYELYEEIAIMKRKKEK